MGGTINSYKILIKKRKVKRPLGNPREEWENNIKMYVRELGCRV
jgi:hypothetical protein